MKMKMRSTPPMFPLMPLDGRSGGHKPRKLACLQHLEDRLARPGEILTSGTSRSTLTN